MKKYNCLQAIPLSFYSPDLYRDVAKNWGAGVFLYLLMLLAFCSAIWTIPSQLQLNKNFETHFGSALNRLILQAPLITIKPNGSIETPENRPYLIRDLSDNKVMMVIDTSGHYTTVEHQSYDILLTKTEYIIRNHKGDIQIKQFPRGVSYVIYPEKVEPVK